MENNKVPFETYQQPLENWVTPPAEKVDRAALRKVLDTLATQASDKSDASYPMTGERERKRKNMVAPAQFQTMCDLQTDAATFATFSPPGIYRRSDPRKTELGRFVVLEKALFTAIQSLASTDTLHEITLHFNDPNRQTTLTIGGFNLKNLPRLAESEAHKGWQNSMGFGNHTFYETYAEHLKSPVQTNPYYAFLTDEQDRWLDSHSVGIDGPLLHVDSAHPARLHLWLLSFERHALVGHYTFDF